MLSVIIPTDGVEQPAVATLAALVPGAAAGVVREVLLVDRAGSGVIERVEMHFDRFAKLSETQILELDMPAHREVRAIDLQYVSRRNDRVVLGLHRFGDRANVALMIVVVIVAEKK